MYINIYCVCEPIYARTQNGVNIGTNVESNYFKLFIILFTYVIYKFSISLEM